MSVALSVRNSNTGGLDGAGNGLSWFRVLVPAFLPYVHEGMQYDRMDTCGS